ncbi:MAG: DAK2 domain-containing protein [Oscillospiraceae bacterium]|nr:DAK2 domain-containing protein [Oscillospiraceae bacterium]
MIQYIDAAAYIEMIKSGAALIERNKQFVNELNVFPVPDGDTGTNMSMTINAGVTALSQKAPKTVTAVADTAAGALLRGARGNSGVILSLLFRGMSKALKSVTEMTVVDFSAALSEGVTAAYKAVMRPTEGTILTVSRLVAEAAARYSESGEDFMELFETLISAGDEALAGTTEQNPVLKKAGVVDSGGQGYMFLLKGMYACLQGDPVTVSGNDARGSDHADFAAFRDEDITFTYCTEFIVNRENRRSPEALRDYLSGVGDSLVFVEDDEIIKAHVHTDQPGDVLTQALKYGSFVSVKIENMRNQHTQLVFTSESDEGGKATEEPVSAPETPVEAAPEKKYGTVAVCAGEGIGEVFRNLGADALVTGGQTMNPSTEDILTAVQSVPSEVVFVLPNNKNIIMAAQQCDRLTEKTVIVIPSKTIPQGVSSLISFDDSLSTEELTEALTEATKSVKTAQITYASRDSDFDGLKINAGEYLALLEGGIVGSGRDLAELLSSVSRRFAEDDCEVITVYYGEDVDEYSANAVAAKFRSDFPDADVTAVYGGQPVYYYMISAE